MKKTNLQLQFDAITPQYLKDNETISKLLDIYNSSFAESEEVLSNPLQLLDSDFLVKKMEEGSDKFNDIRKELFKIHLQEIYQSFEDIGDSEEIYKKFTKVYEALNIPVQELKIVAELDKSISSEYLEAASSFKTKKGTKSGFFFVYDIINRAGIQAINSETFFNLVEGTKENVNEPFQYTVETSLYKEVFNKTVVPLAHPVGFNWNFIRLLFLTMEDYFGLEKIETLSDTALTCYGSADEANRVEIVKSKIYGELKNFNSAINQDNDEEIVIDYYPIDKSTYNGLRLTRQFNGRVILYDRQSIKQVEKDGITDTQYLEIAEIRVKKEQDQNGILFINRIDRTLLNETFEVIESIDFKEYTIIDKTYIDIEFRIKDDFENHWNSTRLYFNNKEVSDDIKYFKNQNFDREYIISHCLSYNGRIVEDKGSNCLLSYKAKYTYKLITKDISENIDSIRSYNGVRASDTRDINLTQLELEDAKDKGIDPYEGLYNTKDHTLEEFNWYRNSDWVRRLDKAKENFGGYNSNLKRWEQYYRNSAEEDLNILYDDAYKNLNIKAKNSRVFQYEKSNNIENPEFLAWELKRDFVQIKMFSNESYYNLDKENYYEVELGVDGKEKLKDSEIKIIINEGTDEEEIVTKTDKDGNKLFYLSTLYKAREETFKDIMFKPTILTPADGLRYVKGEEVENYNNNQKYKISEGLIDSDPVNMQLETTSQMFINFIFPMNDSWTVLNNSLIHFNSRDLEEANAGNQPVVDSQNVFLDYNVEVEFYKEKYTELNHNFDSINMDTKNEYSYKIFGDEPYVGDEAVAGKVSTDGNLHYEMVKAEIYRGQWNERENHPDFRKYEKVDFIETKTIQDLVPETTEAKTEVHESKALKDSIPQIEDRASFLAPFNMNTKDDYCYDTFVELEVSEENSVGCNFVNTIGYHKEVQAEIYRNQWNFQNSNLDYEKVDFTETKTIQDLVPETTEAKTEVHESKALKDSIPQIEDRAYFLYPFNMDYEKDYCYDTLTKWNIDTEYIGCNFIDGVGIGEKVQAEIYRNQWNFQNSNLDYEKVDFTETKTIQDLVPETTEIESIEESKKLKDFSFRDYEALLVSDDVLVGGTYESSSSGIVGYVSAGYEELFKDKMVFGTSFELGTLKEYCYDTFIPLEAGDDTLLGCNFVDGESVHTETKAEIYRAKWNFINEKYEIITSVFTKTIQDLVPETTEIENIKESKKVQLDVAFKDEQILRVNDEGIEVGGTFNSIQTGRKGFVSAGYENYFIDMHSTSNQINIFNKDVYSYNTFNELLIGDFDLSNDFIDGKGEVIYAQADTYRVGWNNKEKKSITTDNVITSEFEIYGMKCYKKDEDGNWVYLPDNNIDAA